MNRLACAVLLVLLAATVQAKNLIRNGSFENGTVPNNCFIFDLPVGSTTIKHWVVTRGTIDWDGPPPCSVTAAHKTHSLDLVGQHGIGGIAQTFNTTAGQCYKVTFELAGNPEQGNPPVIKPLAVNISNATAPAITAITPQAQGCSIVGSGATCTFGFDVTGKSASNMGWTQQTLTFTATSKTSQLEFVSDITAFGPPGNAGANLDRVKVKHCP